jgi:truncated hemoglobin YjbI
MANPFAIARPDPRLAKIEDALFATKGELYRAMSNHPAMHSHHEAYGIIQEEVDEFWDIVKLKAERRDKDKTREELVQIAAMACRALIDLELL